MVPYPSFLVFGKVLNSQGFIIVNAKLEVITSFGRAYKFTDSNGLYLYDLAEIGYTVGETVNVNITEPFNNEIQIQTYTVEGSFLEENVATRLRTKVKRISELQTQNVLHSVGRSPITLDNPLPIKDTTYLLEEYVLSGGDDDNRIYGYVNLKGAWYIQKYDDSTLLYKYVKGSSNFITSWNNRANLTYKFFNEVFG